MAGLSGRCSVLSEGLQKPASKTNQTATTAIEHAEITEINHRALLIPELLHYKFSISSIFLEGLLVDRNLNCLL